MPQHPKSALRLRRLHLTVSTAMLGCAAVFSGFAASAQQPQEPNTSRAVNTPQSVPQPSLSQAAQRIIAATNDFRAGHKLASLVPQSELQQAASQFAQYMATGDRYGHTADGHEPAERAKAQGYDYCIVAENIAYQYDSHGFTTQDLADKFVEGWRQSPEHRRNMLDPDVYDTAVAVAHSAKSDKYYAVQLFGRPKSKQVELSITNRSDATVAYVLGQKEFSLPPRYTRTHARCRPAQLVFELQPGSAAGEGGMQEKSDGGSKWRFRPGGGEHYIVVQDAGGALRVIEQSPAEEGSSGPIAARPPRSAEIKP